MRLYYAVLMIVVTVFLFNRCVYTSQAAKIAVGNYVGSDKCRSCHQPEFALFEKSDHYHAMDTVSAATVKGNFDNALFIFHGDTTLFYKNENGYFVHTTDSTGKKTDFKVEYTFGWQPLQQYLVRFTDGRIQVLPFCWDTRDKEKGGQRWFHLYNKENIPPGDELFWMGINQNWNYMCADCHTTDFNGNYDLAADKFNSTWKENRVSCESCHGPASGHMEWADTKDLSVPLRGFSISLAAKQMEWKMDDTRGILMPQNVQLHDTLIETCARCHARATRFTDQYTHGASFLQSHIPAVTDTVNYYIDGQIKAEDYEYASFLQSKMYAAGVTCINCHDPHSMKVKASGNQLCSSCHKPEKYDSPAHSFHKQTSTGNQCVSCHMPTTTYMVVDNRLDHSIRIPRPDLSEKLGTPNACNKCHTDKSTAWAATNFKKWYGDKISNQPTHGELMFTVSKYIKESESALAELLQAKAYPAIIRATAMDQYGELSSPVIKKSVVAELAGKDPLLRLSAVKAIRNAPPAEFVPAITPLLKDDVAAVRFEVMNTLAPYSRELGAEDQQVFMNLMNQYVNLQERMSHRPEGYFNRAILYQHTGNAAQAEQLYLSGIQRFPEFIPSYSNLVDLYREAGREDEAKKMLDRGLMKQPKSGWLHYALGLWHIRQHDNQAGLDELKKAAGFEPANAQFVYGYAIGVFSMGDKNQALQLLEKFAARYGYQSLILDGLISVSADLQQAEKSAAYEKMKASLFGF